MNESTLMVPVLLVVNLMTYFLYWWDKRQAVHNEWRVPESALLMMSFIGGSPAGFAAQRILRHKNRKLSFQIKFWVIVLVQAYGVLMLLLPPPPA